MQRIKYNVPLCIAFIHYEKAFDSEQTQAVLTALQKLGKEELLNDIYTNSSMTVHLHNESNSINIRRGVRQIDTISPELFTAALESIFRRLTWETRGLKIDGEYLCHLRFANGIFLCANAPIELHQMLQELANENEIQGLKMNKSKTKVMMENAHQYKQTTFRSRTLKTASTWDRDTALEANITTMRLKEKSRPDGLYSTSTATSSRVTLKHVLREKPTIHEYFQQWHMARKHGHSPVKQRTS